MRKKIIILLVMFILLFALIGCSNQTYEDAQQHEVSGDNWANGYFTIVKSWGGMGSHQNMIVYANDTKVMYYIDAYSVAGGITPLYNADGTLQIYNK